MALESDERPWGRYDVLTAGDGWKVKRIEVRPRQRLSYQTHAQRAEHWMVVEGHGNVTLDGVEIDLPAGTTVDIGVGQAHRMSNPGDAPLVFIEVQQGAYLGEDDIVRLDDDYER
jgi:mannose-6-phosphate isomerase-like protein (cupin superfamily)